MKITQTFVFIFIAVPELKKKHKPLCKGSSLVDDPQVLHRQNTHLGCCHISLLIRASTSLLCISLSKIDREITICKLFNKTILREPPH